MKKIARELSIKTWQVEAVIGLIDEGNTIPFIARYRKEKHGSLDDEQLRELDERLRYLRGLEERKETLEGRIKLAFGDAEAISYGGDTLATWKAPKPSKKFDAKAYQADHADLCAPYVVETQGARRFLLK